MTFGTADWICVLLWLACMTAGCLLAARTLIHWFQLESYQFPGYFRTLKRQGQKALLPGLLTAAGFFLCSAALLELFELIFLRLLFGSRFLDGIDAGDRPLLELHFGTVGTCLDDECVLFFLYRNDSALNTADRCDIITDLDIVAHFLFLFLLLRIRTNEQEVKNCEQTYIN